MSAARPSATALRREPRGPIAAPGVATEYGRRAREVPVKRDTHVVAGVGLSLYLLSPRDVAIVAAALGGIIGSLAPDLDLKLKHRALLHSLVTVGLLCAPALYVGRSLGSPGPALPVELYETFFLAIAISWSLHSLTDALNPAGVALLWPFISRRFRAPLSFRHDSLLGNLLVQLAGVLLLALYVSSSLIAP